MTGARLGLLRTPPSIDTTPFRPNGLLLSVSASIFHLPLSSLSAPTHPYNHTSQQRLYRTALRPSPRSSINRPHTVIEHTSNTYASSYSTIRSFSVKRNNHAQPLEYTPVATGKAGTKQYRIYYYKNADDAKSTKSSAISPWHHIGYKSDEMHNGVPLYRFVNEIPKNTIEKYEIATTEVANPLKQDVKNDELRVFKYGKIPFNYGAIPQTWEDPDHESKETTNLPGDNDPVDVVEISDKALQQGYVYDVKPIGILALIDENETDWKVIAVAKGSKLFSKVNDASSLEQHAPQLIEKIKDWFIHYKTADGKKENTLALNGEIKDPKFTVDIIEACHQQWDSLTNRLDEVKLWVPPITHSI